MATYLRMSYLEMRMLWCALKQRYYLWRANRTLREANRLNNELLAACEAFKRY